MKVLPILLLSVLAGDASLEDFVVDGNRDPTSRWTVDRSTPPLRLAEERGRRVCELHAPFATNREIDRVFIDREVQLDLSQYRDFTLLLAIDHPKAVAHFTLYFRSGDGWLGCSARATESGWQTLHFPREQFRAEEEPTGWHKVDGIRLAAWRGDDVDAHLRLIRLGAAFSDIALIVPDGDSDLEDGEVRTAHAVADRVAGMLDDIGLPSDRIAESELDGRHGRPLALQSLAILAYNPRLDELALTQLEEYLMLHRGRLLVCYSMPPRLAELLGMRRTEYVREEREGEFAEIRFEAPDVIGLPASVKQASWNLHVAEPVAHNARTIGHWYDDAGRPTGRAAMLLSDRGAYLTHIVLGDDPESKQQVLAAVLGHLVPELWEGMASAARRRLYAIGHCDSVDRLERLVRDSGQLPAIEPLQVGLAIRERAEDCLVRGDYAEAVNLYNESRERLTAAYLRAQPSVSPEGRAVWNHSGTGAWPGDWERSARVLAESGFNLVLPNLLWAGRAHYPSEVLPRSDTFARYGDQVQQCVDAAHRHDLRVHVWKVNWNLAGAPREFVDDLRRSGRTQVSVRGEPLDWLCPSHPDNFKLEVDSLLEVARKYEVDGLHFDYIRYPGGEYCYCDGCRERFAATLGRQVENWPEDCFQGALRDQYRDWRCKQITRLVQRVHDEGKRIRPDLAISAAVFGAYPSCRESVGQEWPAWIRAGLLDFVCPMDYTESDEKFCSLVENQLRLIEGRIPIYPGIGVTASNSTLTADRVAAQIHHARRLGANGFTIFNFSESLAESILPALAQGATGVDSSGAPDRGRKPMP